MIALPVVDRGLSRSRISTAEESAVHSLDFKRPNTCQEGCGTTLVNFLSFKTFFFPVTSEPQPKIAS